MIREVTYSDMESISLLIHEAWHKSLINLVTVEALDSLTVENFASKLKDDITSEDNSTIVYESNNKIVGYASGNTKCKDFDSELSALYVSPKTQHSGIGSCLFREMKSLFKSQHKSTMIVWTLQNAPNNLFYSSKKPIKVTHRNIIISGAKFRGTGFVYLL